MESAFHFYVFRDWERHKSSLAMEHTKTCIRIVRCLLRSFYAFGLVWCGLFAPLSFTSKLASPFGLWYSSFA